MSQNLEAKIDQQDNSSSLTKEKVLFTWKAPSRPFKRRDREFFTTVLAIAFLSGLILVFLEGLLMILVIVSIVFLVYVLSTVPPEEVEHSLTNKGIIYAGQKQYWEDLTRFWYTKRFGAELLVFETKKFPGRVEMVINQEDKEKIKKDIEKYLRHEEAAPNFLDKSASWLSKKIPLEG